MAWPDWIFKQFYRFKWKRQSEASPPACKPMKPTGWKRARRGCSACASESAIHKYSIFNFGSSGSGIRIRKIQVFDEKILKAYLFRQGQVFDTLHLFFEVFSQRGIDQHHGTTGFGSVSGKTDFSGKLVRVEYTLTAWHLSLFFSSRFLVRIEDYFGYEI